MPVIQTKARSKLRVKVVFLDAFPYTSSGKIARKDLRVMAKKLEVEKIINYNFFTMIKNLSRGTIVSRINAWKSNCVSTRETASREELHLIIESRLDRRQSQSLHTQN